MHKTWTICELRGANRPSEYLMAYNLTKLDYRWEWSPVYNGAEFEQYIKSRQVWCQSDDCASDWVLSDIKPGDWDSIETV